MINIPIPMPIPTKLKFIFIYIMIIMIGLSYSYYLLNDFYPSNPIFPYDFIDWIFMLIMNNETIISIVLANIILFGFYIYSKF